MNSTVLSQLDFQSGIIFVPILTFFLSLLVGFILTRLIGMLLTRLLSNISLPTTPLADALDIPPNRFLVVMVTGTLYVLSISISLHLVGIFSVLLLWGARILFAALIVGGLLYLGDIVRDLYASRKLSYNLQKGDILRIPLVEGKVLSQSRRSIEIKEKDFEDGMSLFIPKTYLVRLERP